MSSFSVMCAILSVFLTSVVCFKPILWEEQIIWVSEEVGEVNTYRIPMIINASNGDLLAFVEARKFGAGDAGAKFIAMRRSRDKGDSWDPTVVLVDDYVVPDGLNLGAIMYDYEVSTLVLLYNYCGHDSNTTKCVLVDKYERGIYIMRSENDGYTWTDPVNAAKFNPDLENFRWTPGPTQGIQKMLPPHRGRLIACGHIADDEDHSMYCLYSDVFLTSAVCLKPIIWEEQVIWASEEVGEVHTYRIPIIINASNGDLLAFAEARKFSAGDAGAKFLAMRRSKDKGDSWGPTVVLVDDYEVPDGLNLGAIMYDYEVSTLVLLYNFCFHDSNTTKCVLVDKQERGIYMMRSENDGYTWTDPVNAAKFNPDLENFWWTPGPTQGIQKMLPPHKGRLIVSGHLANDANHSMFCLYSDDHGFTWHKGGSIVGIPAGQPKKAGDLAPGETQIVELPDGSVYIAVRNTHWYHCHCRIYAYSFDGAETFSLEDLYFDEVLLDPNVCGSILLHAGTLYFANANSLNKRVNMTLRWSPDLGATWPGMLQIYSGPSAYPCLTSIDYNHIGLIYEKNDYTQISFVKVRLNP